MGLEVKSRPVHVDGDRENPGKTQRERVKTHSSPRGSSLVVPYHWTSTPFDLQKFSSWVRKSGFILTVPTLTDQEVKEVTVRRNMSRFQLD